MKILVVESLTGEDGITAFVENYVGERVSDLIEDIEELPLEDIYNVSVLEVDKFDPNLIRFELSHAGLDQNSSFWLESEII